MMHCAIARSDVIYSASHAAMLPLVIARRAARTGARLCAMVPVRSAEHTHAFFQGLQQKGMTVMLAHVTSEWVHAVVAMQQHASHETLATPTSTERCACNTRATTPYDAATTVVREGEIVFVEAVLQDQVERF